MNIAKTFVTAIKMNFVGYLVMIQIVLNMMITRGVDWIMNNANNEEAQEEFFVACLELMFADKRSLYVLKPIVVNTVARHNYFGLPEHVRGSFDMHLRNVSTMFDKEVEAKTFVTDYSAATNEIASIVKCFIEDNKAEFIALKGEDVGDDEALATLSRMVDEALHELDPFGWAEKEW